MRADHPGVKEVFEVGKNFVKRNGVLYYEGPAVLRWETNTFHKVGWIFFTVLIVQVNTTSPDGSTSINFAVRYPGFDLHTEFNIYELDETTMAHKLLRVGKEDQM